MTVPAGSARLARSPLARTRVLTLLGALALMGPAEAQDPWNAEVGATLTASDAATNDSFGWAVDLLGDTAVVGSINAQGNTGAVYVFERDGAAWAETQKLLASDPATDEFFGADVAIWRDTLVVGAFGDGGQSRGAAYVFRRIGDGPWVQEAKLTAPVPAPLERYGWAVDIHEDTLVVGAWGDSEMGQFAGAAYVYDREDGGTTWTLTTKLTADDAAPSDVFGHSVALARDRLAIGSPRDIGLPEGGKVYTYRRGLAGNWSFEGALENPAGMGGGGNFGFSLAMNAAGYRLAVGAPFNAGVSGEVFVFDGDEYGWSLIGTIPSGPGASSFGQTVAVENESVAGGTFTGEPSVHRRTASGSGWLRTPVVIPGMPKELNPWLYPSVALFGNTLLVGDFDSDEAVTDGGVVHVIGLFDFAVPYCFGVGCPCGNDDPHAGCAHSGGEGTLLEVLGSNSLAAGDLTLRASGAPGGNSGLFVSGDQDAPAPIAVGDGLVCVGGSSHRYLPSTVTPDGFLINESPLQAAPPELIFAGGTRGYQAWTRDVTCGPPPAPCPTPCGNGSNLSNAVRVTLAP